MGDLETNGKKTEWTWGTQTFVVENAAISDGEDTCAMLLDAPVVPLLPKTLQIPPPGPNPPTFFVADAGIKGAGMFAARDIPAGALILVDRPIAVVPSNVDSPWKREAFDALLPRISDIERDRLLALANCKPLSEFPLVEGIALTNAFQISLPVPPTATPQEYGGVFPDISRANHSCGLNIAVKWDPASFSASLYALRPIRTGEEIFNQYIDVLAPRADRRAQLARYGFTCMCAHCDLPDAAAVARSDAARTELRDWRHLHPRFLPWSLDACRADDTIIVSNRRALALIEQEGLYGMQVPFMEEIALSYAVMGDEARFLRVGAEGGRVVCGAGPAARGRVCAVDCGSEELQAVGLAGEAEVDIRPAEGPCRLRYLDSVVAYRFKPLFSSSIKLC
ncbi:hypothetical protein B0H16DRAFT_916054 [Mycena metata]|uniref:SET domain-containing protein n=1 Tax=Mycena metata TaxID=1033252 RepID=A0AAD7IPG4_9AGAR|nr:hypothetical protein B0H16DRAFT_916054 [Mycena metata]